MQVNFTGRSSFIWTALFARKILTSPILTIGSSKLERHRFVRKSKAAMSVVLDVTRCSNSILGAGVMSIIVENSLNECHVELMGISREVLMSEKMQRKIRKLARYYKINPKHLSRWWNMIPSNHRDWDSFELAVHQEVQKVSK